MRQADDRGEEPLRRNRQVFLWTDLQRAGLRSPLDPGFPAGAQIDVIDVGRPLTRNLAVELVQAEQTDLREGKPVRVSARIFNAGLFPARDVPVKLALNGIRPLEQRVTLEGRTRRLVHFDVPIKEPAIHTGFVELKAGDELPFDDRRYVAFETRLPERVLLVDGEPGPSVFGNETYYLETALRLGVPGEESKEGPATPYEPGRIAGEGSAYTLPDLARYRIIFLCNVAEVTSEQAAALSHFVAAGGSLVIMVGDQVGSGAYASLEQQSCCPAGSVIRSRLPAAGCSTGSRITRLWLHLPIRCTEIWSDLCGSGARSPALSTGARWPVPSSTQDGLPFPCRTQEHAARPSVSSTPRSPPTTPGASGPFTPSYLPLVHQVAGYLTDRLPGRGRVQEIRAGRGEGEIPGVTIADGRALVRNVDPAESDVERTTLAKLRAFYRLPDAIEKSPNQDRPEILAAGSERPDEFWRAVAWILLVVLVIETFGKLTRTYA